MTNERFIELMTLTSELYLEGKINERKSKMTPPAVDAEIFKYDNGMIGRYVVVRCSAAGVHSGTLESHHGQECVLTGSRRLWYWKAAKGAFLSAVAKYGLDSTSKLGTTLDRIHLTENCEILMCTDVATESIKAIPDHA